MKIDVTYENDKRDFLERIHLPELKGRSIGFSKTSDPGCWRKPLLAFKMYKMLFHTSLDKYIHTYLQDTVRLTTGKSLIISKKTKC